MRIFEKYDERSQAIENAGGNLAFKVLWMLLSISLIVITLGWGIKDRNGDYLILLLEYFSISMISTLFMKYYYCWRHNIDKKLLVAKFFGSIVISILIMIVAVIFIIIIVKTF